MRYNAFRGNNPSATVLDFDNKLGLNTFPYPNNKYQSVIECHYAISQALTSGKASQVNQANLHRTLGPTNKVGDKILLSTKYIHIKNVLYKMKPLGIGTFTILSANYESNTYSLDLSSDPSLNIICNTFHISQVKPYANNNSHLFPERQLAKPGPVS